MPNTGAKIISVHSFRGGTGKSNATANLATLLALQGKRVGVVDTDIQSPGIHVTPMVDYLSFDVDRPENFRRSVYRFIFRTLPDPFMETLDCADASQLTPVRSTSVTALQALTMLNNRFIIRQSEHIAARLEKLSPELSVRVGAAYELILGRPATTHELEIVAAYATRHGLANAVRMLLNSNEFMFVN